MQLSLKGVHDVEPVVMGGYCEAGCPFLMGPDAYCTMFGKGLKDGEEGLIAICVEEDRDE